MPNETMTAAGAVLRGLPFSGGAGKLGTRAPSISGCRSWHGPSGEIVGGDDASPPGVAQHRRAAPSRQARRGDVVKISVFLSDIADGAVVAPTDGILRRPQAAATLFR